MGSVIPTRSAVIPSAVGVDIGCCMVAAELGVTAAQLPDSVDLCWHWSKLEGRTRTGLLLPTAPTTN